MKRIFTAFATVLITGIILAQSPEAISYQAVVRNSSDQLVTNTQVGMQMSILQGSVDGSPVYVETQTPTTNANGLMSVEIGTGITSDDFSAIDWSSGTYFIKTETDPSGGTNYSITGTSQLLSVPYALFAKDVENNDDDDADPTNEIQDLAEILTNSNDANSIQIKNIAEPSDEKDAVTKGYVTLRVTITGDTLFLGENQFVIVPGVSNANNNSDTAIASGYYQIDDTTYTVDASMFWNQSSMGGDPYLRLLTSVSGQDNPDLLKLYPNKGLGELPATYTWDAGGTEGTYDIGYTADYAGMAYDWYAIGKTGSGDLTIVLSDNGVYTVEGEMILSIGYYNFSSGLFLETDVANITLSYVGPITPLQ